jgi:hypothetical protein
MARSRLPSGAEVVGDLRELYDITGVFASTLINHDGFRPGNWQDHLPLSHP